MVGVGLSLHPLLVGVGFTDQPRLGALSLRDVLVVETLRQRDDGGGILAGGGRYDICRCPIPLLFRLRGLLGCPGYGLLGFGDGPSRFVVSLGHTFLGLLLGVFGLGLRLIHALLQGLQIDVQSFASGVVAFASGCLGVVGVDACGGNPALRVGLALFGLPASSVNPLGQPIQFGHKLVPLPAHPSQVLALRVQPVLGASGVRRERRGAAAGVIVALPGTAVFQVILQRNALGVEASQLDHNLVEEVVDLRLVITTT